MNRFKVLTIDGGGILGLYSATILQKIEEHLRQTQGKAARIVDYADLICGTSTGGLIALALALRVPTETICQFYEKHGPDIFPKSQSLWRAFRQTLFGGKFSDRPLRRALEEILQEHKIGDSQCLLCLPTYDFTHGTYGLFRYDHPEGDLNRHNKLSMVDVALATSAAPTYFPLAQIAEENNTQYVDGGVWANNPSLIGLTEAMKYFVGSDKKYDHLDLLSIASLSSSSGKPPLLNRYRSFINWRDDLFNMSLIGQSEFADHYLETLQQGQLFPLTYTRIPSADISPEQNRFIKLDMANEKSFSLMKQFAVSKYYEYRKKPEVKSFFAEPKTYFTNNS